MKQLCITDPDGLQALAMAASLVRGLLEGVIEDGGRILDAADRSKFSVAATFGRIGQAPPERAP